jgi:hypothetical protein
MTRRMRARRDSGNEAGPRLHSTTLYFALSLSLYHASLFASLASVVYLWGGYLVWFAISATKLAGQCSNDFSIFCLLEYFFCDLSSDKKCTSRHRPGSCLAWSYTQYRNAPFFL